MITNDSQARIEAKTPEQRFKQMLIQEFQFAPKIAEAILLEAQTNLVSQPEQAQPGQIQVVLAKRRAGHGQSVRETANCLVNWTLDAGAEDRQVYQQHGAKALRQVRLQRLLVEALEQEAVATQEDLAQALKVSLRTIKRDFEELQAQGLY